MSGRYLIRFAKSEDEALIIAFLRNHWRHDHIFVTNPDVMRWQHQSPDYPCNELTFVLAQNEEGELLALLGYIPIRRFDHSSNWTELALAIWKVRDDVEVPGLGLQLLKTIQRKLAPDMIYAVGITPAVRPIYKALGFSVGVLSHVALFAEDESSSCIIASGVPSIARQSIPRDPLITFIFVSGEVLPDVISPVVFDSLGAMALPRKSWEYVLERYIRHPWYNYDIAVVLSEGKPGFVLVWRKVSTPMGSILRIVDVFGHVEMLERCGAHLRDILAKSGCDYIDLVGWADYVETLARGGFVSCNDYHEMVLPAYFSPYEHRNVSIEAVFKCGRNVDVLPVRLHRADSDQDRPNSLNDMSCMHTLHDRQF